MKVDGKHYRSIWRDAGTGTHRAEIAALMVLILDTFLGRRRG